MYDGDAVGFWSYAHEDNRLDGGAVLKLSQLIQEEYDLISGQALRLFVDRDSLSWGDEWRQRVDSALAETTFFIPIITPRYFTRPECRRELLEFAGKARSLGVEELLLPILYVETPGLSTESSDEAIALIARTQYVDWRANRLLEPDSRGYRREVSALASRLLEIGTSVAERQIQEELGADDVIGSVAGIADVVEQIEALLPDWLTAVMGDKVNTAQIRATYTEYQQRLDKLRRSGAPASAIAATHLRLGRELLPLTERFVREGQIYVARSTQLDPFVSSLARLLVDHPDGLPLAANVREAVGEAMESMRNSELSGSRGDPLIYESIAPIRHLSRTLQKCYALLLEGERLAGEGNDMVRRWERELEVIHP